MANYCFNSLDIEGREEDIKAFKELIKTTKKEQKENGGEEWDLSKVIPIEVDDDGRYLGDVYEKWGTKWFCGIEIDFSIDGASAGLSFDTAWSPSLPVTLEISRRFNLKINHYYEESGCDFEGNYEVDCGDVVNDSQRAYSPYCEKCGMKGVREEMVYDENEGEHFCVGCDDELAGIVEEKMKMIEEKEDKK